MLDTTNPLNDPDNPLGDAYYRPELPIQCHQCLVLARSERQYKDHEHPHVLMHRAELVRRRRR